MYQRRDLIRVWEEFPSGPEGVFLKRGSDIHGLKRVPGFPFVVLDQSPDRSEVRFFYGKSYIYPLFAAPFRRPGARRETNLGDREAWAIGAWLPELEFTHYSSSPHWRQVIDSCRHHLVVSGNCLAATALVAGGTLTLPGTAIDTGGNDLTLASNGGALSVSQALRGNNISLAASGGMVVAAAVTAAQQLSLDPGANQIALVNGNLQATTTRIDSGVVQVGQAGGSSGESARR